MKSYFKLFFVLICFLALGVTVACNKMSVPTSGAYSASSVDRLLVHDLENSGSSWKAAVNPNLYNLNPPVTGFMSNPADILYHLYDAPTGGGYMCVQMRGNLTDLGNGDYPSYQMRLNLKSGTRFYDMGFFSGVKFYFKMPNKKDTVLMNNFNLNLKQSIPVTDGGDCDNGHKGCYNNFAVPLDYTGDLGRAVWVEKSYAWSDFSRENWGNAMVPPTLSGQNLKELVSLEWQSKRNNAAGVSKVEMYVDTVSFY